MLFQPDIDPVAIELGPLRIHWYGIMYLVAFGAGWWLGRVRARATRSGWRAEQVDDLLFFAALGVILGGRIGHTVFYAFESFLESPLVVFMIWRGGMSFHGGLLGVLVALFVFARRRERSFFEVTDFVAPLVPIGLAAGRLGNFINGELWGKPSDLPWAMVFRDPLAGGVPRHPSQLYECLLEGVVLFVALWLYSARPRPAMAVSGAFLAGYGALRVAVEFVRVPDQHIGYVAFGWVTMGQALSLPMVLAGVWMLWWSQRRGAPAA